VARAHVSSHSPLAKTSRLITYYRISREKQTASSLEINRPDLHNSGAETCRSKIVLETTNHQELYTGLYLNCRDLFYLEDFVEGFGIMLLKCRLLRSPDIF